PETSHQRFIQVRRGVESELKSFNQRFGCHYTHLLSILIGQLRLVMDDFKNLLICENFRSKLVNYRVKYEMQILMLQLQVVSSRIMSGSNDHVVDRLQVPGIDHVVM